MSRITNRLVSGMAVDITGGSNPWSEVNNMVWYTGAKNVGLVIWYSNGIT